MTRGRNDANEWVKEYKIEHSVDGIAFFPDKDDQGDVKVFISLPYASSALYTLLFTSKSNRKHFHNLYHTYWNEIHIYAS